MREVTCVAMAERASAVRVHVTGFGPFHSVAANPTEVIVSTALTSEGVAEAAATAGCKARVTLDKVGACVGRRHVRRRGLTIAPQRVLRVAADTVDATIPEMRASAAAAAARSSGCDVWLHLGVA